MDNKRLGDLIIDYIEEKIDFSELENSFSKSVNNDFSEENMVNIFHALQHYEIDIEYLESNEKQSMIKKMRNIANNLKYYNLDQLNMAIDEFNNSPYID